MRLSTRLATAMIGLVIVTSCALTLVTYMNMTELMRPRALDRVETHALLNATKLEASLQSVCDDLIGLTESSALAELIAEETKGDDPTAQRAAAQLRRRFAVRFSGELAGWSQYAEIRLIGLTNNGREIVRVDRSGPNDSIRTVPDNELQEKGDRDYFLNSIDLSRRDIYASPVELDRKSDPTGHAPIPTVRFASPLFTADGKPFGIAVINVNLSQEFDRIRVNVANGRSVYIVNERGDYLLHTDIRREFGFEYGNPKLIQGDFPQFNEELKSGRSSGVWNATDGRSLGVGWASIRPAGGPLLTVIETIDYDSLTPATVGRSALIGGGLAIVFAVVAAIWLSRSLSNPLTKLTLAAESLARGEIVPVSTTGNHEIDTLSRAISHMAETIRQKESLLSNIIQGIVDPVVVADKDETIIIANPAAQHLFSVVPGVSKVHGSDAFEVFCQDAITPLPTTTGALARALGGESIQNLQLVVRPRNQNAQSIVLASGQPLKDPLGNIIGAVTTYHNVTELVQAHSKLIESEQMAQAIVDTALDAFIQFDQDGQVSRWSPNAETMFGWSTKEAVGQSLFNLIIPNKILDGCLSRITELLAAAELGPIGRRYVSASKRRDGTEIANEISLTVLHRPNGPMINAFLRDITQQRNAEEQLRQAQKMDSVGQLTGGIAHDFNNMLTVITGTIDILIDALADNQKLSEIAKLISKAADRATRLTSSLLSFSRQQPLLPEEVDINSHVQGVRHLLLPTLGRQITINCKLNEDVGCANVDPGQLSAALVNLAINARDAMPGGGILTFETSNVVFDTEGVAESGPYQPGSFVLIAVSDTGVGMPNAVRRRIFEPFFSTKDVGKGTGLGLSMVYGFVNQSGGHIDVNSEEGSGSSFRIYLPSCLGNRSSDKPASMEPPVGGTETILLVEDDESVRGYAIAQLKSLGYKTISANDAEQALAIIDQGTPFDLMFTDVVMPGTLNGRKLADEAALRRPSLKVLFTSGFAEGTIAHNGTLEAGVLLLEKPYSRSELAKLLRKAIGSGSWQARNEILISRSASLPIDVSSS